MFEIFVKLARGETRLIEVESSESIYDIKTKIQALEGVHPKQQVLIWEDKALYDGRTISSYNIQKESTLLLILRHGAYGGTTTQQTMIRESDPFQTKGTASAIMQEWKQKASQYAFDDDLYIVDPQAYYNHLDSIERTIVHGSEFYRSRGVYDPSDDTLGADNAYEGLPRWFPRSSGSKSGQLSEEASNESEAGRQEIQLALLSLQKSYAILYKVQRNLDHLIESGFAKSRFSLLVGHPEHNLAEIVQIPRFALDDLSVHIEAAIKCISYDLDPSLLQTHLRLFVEIRVRSLLECIGVSSDVLQEGLSPPVILTRCRMVVLLLDLALVCYVGSHGSRFDNQYLKVSTPRITANCDTLSFQCMLQPLACLSGFLDQKKVWVFQCYSGFHSQGQAFTQRSRGLSILARIDDFADIWGPVWAVSTEGDEQRKILQYNVSKGVIRRVDTGSNDAYKSAVRCHWESWPSYYRRRLSRLFTPSPVQYLSPDDLLIIGTMGVNNSCGYTLDDFEATYEKAMTVLGPKPSTWVTDSRSLGISISKIAGISVLGTQKKIPETTLKQHIFERWNNNPSMANPWILKQYLGVEVSHCTGNARRVRLQDLLLGKTLDPLLERQFPGWKRTGWGEAFLAAMASIEKDALFEFWKNYEDERSRVAQLLCSVLELLHETGMKEHGFFATFINNNEELSMQLDTQRNRWMRILVDTTQTAVYALITGTCLECHSPNHSTSICGNSQARRLAHTVLETQISVRDGSNTSFFTGLLGGDSNEKVPTIESVNYLQLHPSGLSFIRARDITSMLLLQPKSKIRGWVTRGVTYPQIGVETRDRSYSPWRLMAFILAGCQSHGGMKRPRAKRRDTLTRGNEVSVQTPAEEAAYTIMSLNPPNSSPTNLSSLRNGVPEQQAPT